MQRFTKTLSFGRNVLVSLCSLIRYTEAVEMCVFVCVYSYCHDLTVIIPPPYISN